MLSENTYTATIGANGRVVIPAAIRREFGWKEGQQITFFRNESGRLEVSDPLHAWEALRALVRQHPSPPEGDGLVDELIRDRREEARREMEAGTRDRLG